MERHPSYLAACRCKGIRQVRVYYAPRLLRWVVVFKSNSPESPGRVELPRCRIGSPRWIFMWAERLAGCPLKFQAQRL